jgi:hypothetical protein
MRILVKSHKRKGRVVKAHMRSLGPWDFNGKSSRRHQKRMKGKIDEKMEESLANDPPISWQRNPPPISSFGVKKDPLFEPSKPKDENAGKVAVPYNEVVNGIRVQRVKYVDPKTLAPNELKRLKLLKINKHFKG